MKAVHYRIIHLFVWFAFISQTQAFSSVKSDFERANDFIYTLASGVQENLYSISSEQTILYFYDPTCEDCHQLMNQLDSSETVNRLLNDGSLTILAVYPEDDTLLWKAYSNQVPPLWINAYDLGAKINTEGIYIIKSIPSLYLLDESKNIRLKEASFFEVENELKLLQKK